jgi:hypothetical protein
MFFFWGGGVRDLRTGFGLDDCIYNTLYIQFITISYTALLLAYTLHKSLGHAKSSQSSLVVSWQQISTQ